LDQTKALATEHDDLELRSKLLLALAQALQQEATSPVAWILATGTGDCRPNSASRTNRRDAVISRSA
jgi:hypothetical protein